MAHYIIVCNWKMYFGYHEAIDFLTNNNLEQLNNKHELIICPSYESLAAVKKIISSTSIQLGSQDCSNHEKGAYTGQVSAQSLKEVGCDYCIIGHYETRNYGKLTDQMIAEKIQMALKHQLKPIICVGEDRDTYDKNQTIGVLDQQLNTIVHILDSTRETINLIIAYEPIWSIGTSNIPSTEHLEMVYQLLDKFKKSYQNHAIRLIYGGSVQSKTIAALKKVTLIQGFLIGKASTDFQELKNIVLSV